MSCIVVGMRGDSARPNRVRSIQVYPNPKSATILAARDVGETPPTSLVFPGGPSDLTGGVEKVKGFRVWRGFWGSRCVWDFMGPHGSWELWKSTFPRPRTGASSFPGQGSTATWWRSWWILILILAVCILIARSKVSKQWVLAVSLLPVAN